MDPLCGIDGSRPSPPRSRKMARRDSSISLEEGPVPVERHSPQTHHSKDKDVFDSAKPPLLLFHPHELHTPTTIREASPEDGCPLLPSEPSLPSSPTVTAPMDVFLGYEDSHEKMRVGGVAPVKAAAQVKQLTSEPAASSLSTSSWQHPSDDDVDPSLSDEARLGGHDKMPRTPVLQPVAGRAITDSSYDMVEVIPCDPIEPEDDPSKILNANIPGMSPIKALEHLKASNDIDGSGARRKYRSGRQLHSGPARVHGRTRQRKLKKDLKEKREKKP